MWQKSALLYLQKATGSTWWWVTFGEQSGVTFAERRSASTTKTDNTFSVTVGTLKKATETICPR
ncbi:MAG: hypothetical protein ABSH05_07005 [Bryobacteraceae bacterium]